MSHEASLRVVIKDIRQRIAQSAWLPGQRLPTRSELADLFGTSPSTVQVAIRELAREGSVETRKRAGTFVIADPPECCRFALVMSDMGQKKSQAVPFFQDRLISAAQAVPRLRKGWRMEVWSADDPQLADALQSGALAGILYFGILEKRPASEIVPLAVFQLPGEITHAAIDIVTDSHALFDLSLCCLRRRNQKRIAVLDTGSLFNGTSHKRPLLSQLQDCLHRVHAAGGMCQPGWLQWVDPQNPLAVFQVTRLLMAGPASQRPQALILMDDHLLPPVEAALKAMNIHLHADVNLAVLAYSSAHSKPTGYIRLGYHVDDLVMEVLKRLSLFRQGNAEHSELRIAVSEL